jgi:hypothetical protein
VKLAQIFQAEPGNSDVVVMAISCQMTSGIAARCSENLSVIKIGSNL